MNMWASVSPLRTSKNNHGGMRMMLYTKYRISDIVEYHGVRAKVIGPQGKLVNIRFLGTNEIKRVHEDSLTLIERWTGKAGK